MPGGSIGFFRRTCATTSVTALLIACGLWADRGADVALGFLGGVVVGLLTLSVTVWVVERLARVPEEIPPLRWPYGLAFVAKFALAAVAIYLLVTCAPNLIIPAAAGYTLPIAVIVLKTLGARVNRRTASP